ncbi:calmodulin-binding receptor-like cytoplasmic kinase 2 [Henckelia pumila]|uniref:calmodulin-binding receptor-like cytoplasmic kinase 2 n=1 Tax=Henckelia pumila TaxID=405737 RepID=UPI003C6E1BD5
MKSPRPGGVRKGSALDTLDEVAESSASSAYYSDTFQSAASRSSIRSITDTLLGCFTPVCSSKSASNVFTDSSGTSTSDSERRRAIYGNSNVSTHSKEPGSVKFTIEEINKATNNFSPSFKIGQGGFGIVYKGQLEDGTLVAVKRAKKIVYDNHLGIEFGTEVQTLARVEHLNLVKFYGFLEHKDERILVVEYVPNGTLREHLDGIHGNGLDFASRLDIATDVAHAVTYLHTYTDHPIIHRDIKSSNILLTENLRAKVADFGFARLGADGESGATHVSTLVKGTAGYLDPEYMKTNQLTDKSDVYSFGVLLVELVTGRRPIEPKREIKERVTVKWAMKKYARGDAVLIMDPTLTRSPANIFAMEKILELGLLCLGPTRHIRPTMRKCAEKLWGVRKDYRDFLTTGAPLTSEKSQMSSSIRE